MLRRAMFILGLCLAADVASAAETAPLQTLFADYWANELRENPFMATAAGVETYNDKIPGVTPADQARRLAEAKAFLARLDGLDLSAATTEDRISADILRFILTHDIDLAGYKTWRIPFLSDEGFETAMTQAVNATPFRSAADYQKYLTRLEALPAYLDQNVANMRQGLADRFVQPKAILRGVLPTFDAQIPVRVEDSPLYAPFRTFPATIPASTQKALAARARATLEKRVIPAFARVRDFMHDDYAPHAADEVGASHLPDGAAYYAALIREHTTRDDLTADEIHALGLQEVARIRKEMEAVIKETGFQGDFAAFQNFLRTGPQFYATTPEDLLRRAAFIAKTIDGKLPGYFGKLPRQTYTVAPVPAEIAPNYTTGRYSPAPPEGPKGGEYWVNTYALDKRPLYELPALTLHEAVPGHHLQIALAYEIPNAPEFRRQFYATAFGEGWGLYAEKLGAEMGIYTTPYEKFGRLSYEMWRACRLVIDTGLHVKGWSRQQAIEYLAANTALSLKNVETEVDRYIAWPGQALGYKIGELTIWRLRAKAEAALGDRFDLRAFHDAVLDDGSLPLGVLEERIDAYIAAARARQ